MAARRYWEQSYPPALRGYRVDAGRLPPGLDQLAATMAAAHGAAPAFSVVLPDGLDASLSFAEVDALSDAFAGYLVSHLGQQPGDVLALQLPSCLHFPVAVFGAWKAGMVVANIDPACPPTDLAARLRDCAASVLVGLDSYLSHAPGVIGPLAVKVIVASLWDFFSFPLAQVIRTKMEGASPLRLRPQLAHRRFEDALVIGRRLGHPMPVRHPVALHHYPGGAREAVVLTHANLLSVLAMHEAFGGAYGVVLAPEDTVLTALPLHRMFAFTLNFLAFFRAGARNVLVPGPQPVINLQPAFSRFDIRWMSGVDALLDRLLEAPWFHAAAPRLVGALTTAKGLRGATADRWRATVGPLYVGYGLADTGGIVSINPPDDAGRPGTAGLPLPGSEVRVAGAGGRPLAPGKAGELLVRGPHVTRTGLRGGAEAGGVSDRGWLRTGDLATMDHEGYITLVGRAPGREACARGGLGVCPG